MSLELREKLKGKDTNLGDSNFHMEFKAIGLDKSPKGASTEEKSFKYCFNISKSEETEPSRRD